MIFDIITKRKIDREHSKGKKKKNHYNNALTPHATPHYLIILINYPYVGELHVIKNMEISSWLQGIRMD